MFKKNCSIVQKAYDYDTALELIKNKILPITIIVNSNQKQSLPNKFNQLYSLEWFSIGENSDKLYYGLDGNKILKLIEQNKINPKYILFLDNEKKKIDKFYKISIMPNKDLERRKLFLMKHNLLEKRCLLSCTDDIWLDNEFFVFGSVSLSEEAINVYKRKHK